MTWKQFDKVVIAHHEAGHAIAGHVLGLGIRTVDITPVKSGPLTISGSCRLAEFKILRSPSCVGYPGGRSDLMFTLRKHATALMAGGVAQKVFTEVAIGIAPGEEQLGLNCMSDLEAVREYSQLLFGRIDRRWINRSIGRAFALVEKH